KKKEIFFSPIVLIMMAVSLMTLITISYSLVDSFAIKNTLNQTDPLSDLFKNVEKSVVQISSEDETTDLLGSRLGSGFVYDTNGHIITNNHVTSGAKDLHITFSDGTIYTGKVIGSDPHSDLAVVLVNDVPKEKLFPLTLGNSSALIVGERVAAVGNPFGLSGSLTEGIVSGLGRLLPSSPPSPENIFGKDARIVSFSIPDIIQTDAAINPGNSGGPLLNLNGEVIGINSAIFSNTGVYAGVGFAIPSNTLKKVIPELIEKGSYKHPWIGITGIDVTPDIAEKMNLTEARGFLVIDVNANGPADKAGIRGGDKIDMINGREVELGGDVIISIDGKPVRKIADVLSHLEREKSVGDKVSLTIIRDGIVQEINTTLEERPDSETLANLARHPSLGITGIDVTPDIAEKMNLTEARGFLVIDVNANGPADKAGIRGGYKVEIINNTQYRLGGDVIVGMDNQTVNSVSDITDYLTNKKEGDIVKLVILRDNEMINVPATLEIIQRPLNELDQIPPFNEPNPKDFDDDQGKFKEELKEECMKNFDENICNFLFR
ncbi:MAG TPA: trypsin-like peptidase domain-containing protein, partial [Nitrososphaeraceae archaeon]|nr:trypsin-like peptidase domain-containing protein [Nitrososphaeraceae archaeon]